MKTGLFVIGYSRPEYLAQCLESLQKNNWGGADYRGVILDYKDAETTELNRNVCARYSLNYIFSGLQNEGVAKTKNRALRKMMEEGCDHLFVMEDDIIMKDPKTCIKYIEYAKMMEVEHMNFAHHGPANVGYEKVYYLRQGVMFCYPHCVGAFSYYSRKCIETVGYMDEEYLNAWEHVDYTWRAIAEGMHPPFWYFVDYPASKKLLEEIPGSIDNSSIRPRYDWQENIDKGTKHWLKKYGVGMPEFPTEDWGNPKL